MPSTKPQRRRFLVYAVDQVEPYDSLGGERGELRPTGDSFVAKWEELGGRNLEFARQQVTDCTHRIMYQRRLPSTLKRNSHVAMIGRTPRMFSVSKINEQRCEILLVEHAE